jgi:hypothetical protein
MRNVWDSSIGSFTIAIAVGEDLRRDSKIVLHIKEDFFLLASKISLKAAHLFHVTGSVVACFVATTTDSADGEEPILHFELVLVLG